MKRLTISSLLLVSTQVLAAAGTAPVSDLARQTLNPKDGWAAATTGTTGGSKAKAENIFTVSTRKDFVAALKAAGNDPKIIQVSGTISLNTDDNGQELTAKDYADPAYDFYAYLQAYDPTRWNRQPLVKGKPPKLTGLLEDARARSVKAQRARVEIHIPSNTTIIGLGKDAKIIHGNLYLGADTDNVIIRNLTLEDAFDFFPAWDPDDSFGIGKTVIEDGVSFAVPGCQESFENDLVGPQRCNGGRWNSEYDLITLKGASHVWIDHCTLDDGEHFDKKFPPVFAAPYNQPDQKVQHHDALIDITNGSNYVTVSYNYFFNHDKLGLIGGSDSAKDDNGKLKVTYHHNLFEHTKQRQPRVRFGLVHSYNNLFIGDRDHHYYPFAYAFGLGISAKVISENNVFELDPDASSLDLISVFNKDAAFSDKGSILNGKPVDIVKDYNAKNPAQTLNGDPGWKPELVIDLQPTADVAATVKAKAGAGKL